MTNEIRRVFDLRPHPKNHEIYNDHADADLIESVRVKGVLNPLLITFDNRIINGHRRWEAAQKAGVDQVDVVVFASRDELDILDALIESNRQRVKTNEQRLNEAIASEWIEEERAKFRKMSGKTIDPSQPVAYGQSNGKTVEILGKRIDRSGEFVRQGLPVAKAIKKLESEGKQREAEQLRLVLNRNVSKANEKARDEGHIDPPQQRQTPKPEPKVANFVTLEQWNELGDEERRILLTPSLSGSQFNDQKNDNIEWAHWSWNPVTGCKHDCPYCYARDIAMRFYDQKFEPAFLPDRLSAPANTRYPSDAQMDIGQRNVFTCSMADLFGRWVPREWIEAVLDVVANAHQWNFLFLTKFPIRLSEFEFPDNAWVGTTVDCQARVKNAEKAFKAVRAKVKWLSCEPLLEPLEFTDLAMFQWIVLGGASESTQTPMWRPPRAWITRIESAAHNAGCMVYEKTNLLPLQRLREYPGMDEEIIKLPDALRYLPSIE